MGRCRVWRVIGMSLGMGCVGIALRQGSSWSKVLEGLWGNWVKIMEGKGKGMVGEKLRILMKFF